MVIAGLPAILEIGPIDFLFGQVWQSTAADPQFGILPFIMTSVWGTLGAVVIGVPIGLCTAIFLSKLAPPKLAAIVHPAVELLAGIPSVVYGLIGMMVLVPGVMNLFDLKSGSTLLTAILVLAVMILPSIISVSETARVSYTHLDVYKRQGESRTGVHDAGHQTALDAADSGVIHFTDRTRLGTGTGRCCRCSLTHLVAAPFLRMRPSRRLMSMMKRKRTRPMLNSACFCRLPSAA